MHCHGPKAGQTIATHTTKNKALAQHRAIMAGKSKSFVTHELVDENGIPQIIQEELTDIDVIELKEGMEWLALIPPALAAVAIKTYIETKDWRKAWQSVTDVLKIPSAILAKILGVSPP